MKAGEFMSPEEARTELVRLLGELAKAEKDMEDAVVMLEDARETAERVLKADGIWDKIARWERDAKAAKAKREAIRILIKKPLGDLFNATGEKTHEAATFVERHGYEIDLKAAFTWAKEKDMALTLDQDAFKKLIDAGVVPTTIGRRTAVPSLKISGDLSKYLPPGEGKDSEGDWDPEETATAKPPSDETRTELPKNWTAGDDIPF